MSWEDIIKRKIHIHDADLHAKKLIESARRDPLEKKLKYLEEEHSRINSVHQHTKRKNNFDYKRYGKQREREMDELKREIDEIKEKLQ